MTMNKTTPHFYNEIMEKRETKIDLGGNHLFK